MWEYKRVNYNFKILKEIEEKINEEGVDGWEIVYYNETKPSKFGDVFQCSVLYKRMGQQKKIL